MKINKKRWLTMQPLAFEVGLEPTRRLFIDLTVQQTVLFTNLSTQTYISTTFFNRHLSGAALLRDKRTNQFGAVPEIRTLKALRLDCFQGSSLTNSDTRHIYYLKNNETFDSRRMGITFTIRLLVCSQSIVYLQSFYRLTEHILAYLFTLVD